MAWRGTPDEAVVLDAVGIIAAQARCGFVPAFDLLTERADALGRTIPDAARLVIAGVVRFDE